jgi:DNA-binding SARP family transcriptional activator/streptogramin lyase
MRYAILGPIEVHDGAAPVSLGGGLQRKLLGILLVHANESVSTDRLIDGLWGAQPPDTAAKALQGLVSQLRKLVGPERLETVAGGYVLRVGDGDLDAHQFEELLRQARRLDRGDAAMKLREALALWHGPALADFAYDDFARQEIERLEHLRETCIERRIDIELALGHHDDLVPELEALVREHPLRERLRRHLMLALYRSGRQADALDAYRETRRVLDEELGLEPSEELQSLQRSILEHDPALAAPPRIELPFDGSRQPPPAPPPRRRRPLVLAAAGAALIAAAATVAVIELTRDDHPKAVVVPPNSLAVIDTRRNRITSYVNVGRRPVAVAHGTNGVWVANADDGTVDRIDPNTGRLLRTIGVGADVNDVTVGLGAVWVAGGNSGTLTRIDPTSGQIERTLALADQRALSPGQVFFTATDGRHAWATRGDELVRIDPSTNQIDGHVKVGAATDLASGGGSLWVTTVSARLVRVDARTVRVTDTTDLDTAVAASAYGDNALWVTQGAQSGSVERIDPSTLTSQSYGTRVIYPSLIAVGGGSVWVGNADGDLERLDARSGRSLAFLHVGAGLAAVAADRSGAWIVVSAS